MMPRGTKPGDPLEKLDDTDFGRQMIVAVFWGEMSFSGQNEKCRIESVKVEAGKLVVRCQAELWGGAVKHAYRAWPYEVRAVPQSDLPVILVQTTNYQAAPKQSQKDKLLATLEPGEWKKEIKRGE